MMWKPFDELRKVNKNYSGAYYSYEWAEEHDLLSQIYAEWNEIHTVCVREEIEVLLDDEKGLLYRNVEDKRSHSKTNEFITQFGKFENHNRGEFVGYLITPSGQYVPGNFVKIVNHKGCVYAIDSMMHMGMGHFRILEFQNGDEYRCIYETQRFEDDDCERESLDFGALYDMDCSLYIVISGFVLGKGEDESYKKCTKILKICDSDVQEVVTIDEHFLYINNMIVIEDYAYISMNKTVAKIHLLSGTAEYYTHLSEDAEENMIEVAKKMKRL